MRQYLGVAERAEYSQRTPRAARQWLLGRIAVKDAVRQWLWDARRRPDASSGGHRRQPRRRDGRG